MATKKTKKLKPLSSYELDSVWMSYRYCIGRKTISSDMRAGDILSNCYERMKLTKDRCEFTAFDIGRSIEDILRFSSLNIYIDNKYQQWHIYPLDEVIRIFLDEDNCIREDNLKNVKKVNIDIYGEGNVDYTITYDGAKDNFFPLNTILDLLTWQNCAKIFDVSKHKFCKTKFEDKEEIIEYVEMYQTQHIESGVVKFELKKVPVDKYVKNSVVFTYINEDYIVEDNI